jgi:hypothetical protein
MKWILPILLAPVLSAAQMPMGGVTFAGTAGTTTHARQFNGSTGWLNSASALSNSLSTNKVSVSFWLYWDAFANDDKLAMEWSTNFGSANAILIDPDESSTGKFAFVYHAVVGSKFLGCNFTRPSAAAWHQYVLTIDIAGQSCTAYLDGVSQTITVYLNQAPTNAGLDSATVYLMSRAGSSLFGAGRMSEPAVYNGQVNSTDAASLGSCGRPTSVSSATLIYYWPINQTSPEVATTGGVNLTVNGTTTVASQCSF